MTFPVARVCLGCRKPGGTYSYVWKQDGKTLSGYWHTDCFRRFRKTI